MAVRAKQLSPEEYQRYKKAWDRINLDSRTDLAQLSSNSFFPSREEYVKQLNDDARFVEARRQALRTSFGLPRKVDYMTDFLKSKGVK